MNHEMVSFLGKRRDAVLPLCSSCVSFLCVLHVYVMFRQLTRVIRGASSEFVRLHLVEKWHRSEVLRWCGAYLDAERH